MLTRTFILCVTPILPAAIGLPLLFHSFLFASVVVFSMRLGTLLEVFMYPGSEGQLRFKNDRERTIDINAHEWDLFDFQHPFVNRSNAKNASKKEGQKLTDKANYKDGLITAAYKKVSYWVQA